MKVNEQGLEIIKHFEGLRLTAYKCPANVWTIGYGTTAAAGVGIEPKAGMTITKDEAAMYLEKTVASFSKGVEKLLKQTPTSNQFSAFVSLAYNIGLTAFSKSSALRNFNEGNILKAADSILLFNKAAGKKLPGLVIRREAERDLFLKPDVVEEPVVVMPSKEKESLVMIIINTILNLFGKSK